MVNWDDGSERDWMEQEVGDEKISHIKKLVICRIGQRVCGENEKFSKKIILPPTPFLYTNTTTQPPRPRENVFINFFVFFYWLFYLIGV